MATDVNTNQCDGANHDAAKKHVPSLLDGAAATKGPATVDGVKPAVMDDATFGAYIERAGEDYGRLSPTPDQYDSFVEQISHTWESQPDWSDDNVVRQRDINATWPPRRAATIC